MNEISTKRLSLGVFTGLFGVILAMLIGLAPAPAQAAGTETDTSIELGGLVFTTTQQSTGPTVTSVDIDETTGVVTVYGGNANFTVTQQLTGSVALATQIEIGGAGNDVYTGTITIQDTTLGYDANGNITASAPVLMFANATPGTTNDPNAGASVVLGNNVKLGSQDTAAIQMASAAATNDTLTVLSGASVTGLNVPAILVGSATSESPSNIGDCVINLEGGTITGGKANGTGDFANSAAVTVNADDVGTVAKTNGSFVINVNEESTIMGSSAIANGANVYAGAQALSVYIDTAYNSSTPNDNCLNINATAALNLYGGSGITGGAGGTAVAIPKGTVLSNGTVNVQGGRGSDNNDSTGTGAGGIGGTGMMLGTTDASATAGVFTVNGGSVVVNGGQGGASAANGNSTKNAVQGGTGGAGVTYGNATDTIFSVTAGTVEINGGNGGNGSVNTTPLGTQGAGGVGLDGGATAANSQLNISSVNPETQPTVTITGGMGNANPNPATLTPAYAVRAVTDATVNPTDGTQGKATWYPWAAVTNGTSGTPHTTNAAPSADNQGELVGFAGMDGTQKTSMQTALYAATAPTYVQILPAPVTGYEAGVVYANNITIPTITAGTGADYVIAQTQLIGTLPDQTYTYDLAIQGEFDGLENVSTSNFAQLLGVDFSGKTDAADQIKLSNGTLGPDDTIGTETGKQYFYVVPSATASEIEVTVDDSAIKKLGSFTKLYPEITTIENTTIPIVYTVTLSAGSDGVTAGTDGAANFNQAADTSEVTTWNLYTNPNGDGTLVYGLYWTSGTAHQAVDADHAGIPFWNGTEPVAIKTLPQQFIYDSVTPYTNQSLPSAATDYFGLYPTFNNAANQSTQPQLIGWFNEQPTQPADWTQVSIDQVSGYAGNTTLTAEWGTVELGPVNPSPTSVAQGESTTVDASYTITPINPDLTSYSINAAGLTADWSALYVNATTGSSTANGLTVKQTGGNTATLTDGKFTVTSQATVTANSTADTGNYRVWPNWGQSFDGLDKNITSTTQYGVVNVTAGTEESTTIDVVRLYNPYTEEHLYTTNPTEVSTLDNGGWDNEGVAWVAPRSSNIPIYRLFNPYNGDHLYTTSLNEYNRLDQTGWDGEGQQLFGAPQGNPEVYRLYNEWIAAENDGAYSHLWTGDFNEYETLGGYGWDQEGVAWFALYIPEPK